jgi:hypothetical protein
MLNLADINKFYSESDKIAHLVKYLEDVDARMKHYEETINALSAHLSSHDTHLESHDRHLHAHDQLLDIRK